MLSRAPVLGAVALVLATDACAGTRGGRPGAEISLTQDQPAGSRPGPPMTISDPNDFYYFEGKPIRLDRSLTEYVVRFRPGALPGERTRIESLLPSLTFGPEVNSEGRTFQRVTVPSPPDGRAGAAAFLERLRADRDVEFAAPFYYRSGTTSVLIPTDDIVVKLKAAGASRELSDITAALGLTVVKTMPGTRDEFVLRLAQPRTADPLENARALFETGRFQWAEPNFIQDFNR